MMNVWFLNPPGPLYQRGEDRSQGNVSGSSATSLRAPNDLGMMAAVARQLGCRVSIRDYPAECKTWSDYASDLVVDCPDAIVMSVTTATILQDMRAFELAKAHRAAVRTVAKGALFQSIEVAVWNDSRFRDMDAALFGEAETILGDVLGAWMHGADLAKVQGVIRRGDRGEFVRNAPKAFVEDLDTIPFPARDLMRNELYVRPDTGEPQATIQTARGCPSRCIFCLTPLISGARVRQRSPANVVDEMEECVTRFGIRNFFLKADTFTINKKFVIELCQEILRRGLDIRWVANSRVDTIDEERLQWMRKAGCWLVAFGFESGDPDSLRRMRKDATVEDAREAVRLVKNAGLQCYGFFLIGLPWEDRRPIDRTLDLAAELRCDFAELHIAVPYEGTVLHRIATEMGLMTSSNLGHDYFDDPPIGTIHLTRDEILRYRKEGIRRLYFSPRFVLHTLGKIRSPRQLMLFATYGARLIRNWVRAS